jgi:hypothetical protein
MKSKVTKKIPLIAICLFFAFCGYSQQRFNFAEAENELVRLFETIVNGENEHVRYNANEQFLSLLKSTLAEDGAFNHPFTYVRAQKLMPKDRRFRMFNWTVRRDVGMEFFAVLMVRNERDRSSYHIFQLFDDSDGIFDLPRAILNKDSWFGAFYTEVIQTEANGRKYYTLLGWNGNDPAVNRRVIEVLTFRPNGEPVFGANVFSWRRERFNRIVFEHSRRGSMILQYDLQAYHEPTGKPARRPGERPPYKLIRTNMIVFDRLVPPNFEMVRHPETFIAAGGVYDALVWIDGRWTLKTDIRARNPAPPSGGGNGRSR